MRRREKKSADGQSGAYIELDLLLKEGRFNKYRIFFNDIMSSPGFDINFRFDEKNTALIKAVFFLTSSRGERDKIAYSILEIRDSDVNCQNNSGETALMWAVRKKRVELVENLVSKGSQIRLRNNAGKTAVDLARETGNERMVNFLRKKLSVELDQNKDELILEKVLSAYCTSQELGASLKDDRLGINKRVIGKAGVVPFECLMAKIFRKGGRITRNDYGKIVTLLINGVDFLTLNKRSKRWFYSLGKVLPPGFYMPFLITKDLQIIEGAKLKEMAVACNRTFNRCQYEYGGFLTMLSALEKDSELIIMQQKWAQANCQIILEVLNKKFAEHPSFRSMFPERIDFRVVALNLFFSKEEFLSENFASACAMDFADLGKIVDMYQPHFMQALGILINVEQKRQGVKITAKSDLANLGFSFENEMGFLRAFCKIIDIDVEQGELGHVEVSIGKFLEKGCALTGMNACRMDLQNRTKEYLEEIAGKSESNLMLLGGDNIRNESIFDGVDLSGFLGLVNDFRRPLKFMLVGFIKRAMQQKDIDDLKKALEFAKNFNLKDFDREIIFNKDFPMGNALILTAIIKKGGIGRAEYLRLKEGVMVDEGFRTDDKNRPLGFLERYLLPSAIARREVAS